MKIIVLFVILLLVPLLIGRLVADIIKKEYCMKPGFWYLSGFLTMLALYQIICVPMTLKEYSFSKLVICYSIVCHCTMEVRRSYINMGKRENAMDKYI